MTGFLNMKIQKIKDRERRLSINTVNIALFQDTEQKPEREGLKF